MREEEGEGVGGRFESLNLYKHDLFFFRKQTMGRGFRGLLTFQIVILTCLVLLSFTPAVDEVVGEDVDICPRHRQLFSVTSLRRYRNFEIVMIGLILFLSCSVREEVGEEGEEG